MHIIIKQIQTEYQFNPMFKLLRVRFQHEKFNGAMSDEVERLVFERGDAVGVLLYDEARDEVLLIKQFRCPAYLRDNDGWLLEIVAGVLDKGRDALTVAHSELFEEIGYAVEHLEFLCKFYPSPGASSEQISLYLGYLHHAERISDGGGLASEHEDIELLTVPFSRAMQMIKTGEIRDAKTIIALQQLALVKFRVAM